MSGSYVLLEFGADPFNTKFEDLEGRPAFTVTSATMDPNLVIKLIREAAWSQQHPTIMGPSSSYFYFGPQNSAGYIMYGNNPNSHPMANFLRQKKDGSTSRYFTSQNGKEYKWRIAPQRMECVVDGRNVLAVWELSQPEDEFHARLTIKHPGLAVVTEIVTTLTLNRMAQTLKW